MNEMNTPNAQLAAEEIIAQRAVIEAHDELEQLIAIISKYCPEPNSPEEAWIVVKARELKEDLDSRDYFDAGYKAAEAKSAAVAKALNAYPDSDLVSLATTLEAIRRKAEVVFPLAQKLVEAVQRIHVGPEASDDCDVCRATEELANALASVSAEPKVASLSFTFCPRCGDQMNPKHDASAPQVDATLEQIASELRSIGDAQDVLGNRVTGKKCFELADAISAHARKSQPGVNTELLKTAINVREALRQIKDLANINEATRAIVVSIGNQLNEAIRAAESAAPGVECVKPKITPTDTQPLWNYDERP